MSFTLRVFHDEIFLSLFVVGDTYDGQASFFPLPADAMTGSDGSLSPVEQGLSRYVVSGQHHVFARRTDAACKLLWRVFAS